MSGTVLSGNILLFGTVLSGTVLSGTVLSVHPPKVALFYHFEKTGSIGTKLSVLKRANLFDAR